MSYGKLANQWVQGSRTMEGREYFFSDDGSTVANIPQLPTFKKVMTSEGPLGQANQVGDERFQAPEQGYSTGDGKVESTLDSLVFTFDKQSKPGIEMREYNDKIYVYIVHSVTNSKGGFFCPSLAFTAAQDLQNDVKVHRDICAVGYFWK